MHGKELGLRRPTRSDRPNYCVSSETARANTATSFRMPNRKASLQEYGGPSAKRASRLSEISSRQSCRGTRTTTPDSVGRELELQSQLDKLEETMQTNERTLETGMPSATEASPDTAAPA